MANQLKDVKVKKLDLVGIPAIGERITLFKSQDHSTEANVAFDIKTLPEEHQAVVKQLEALAAARSVDLSKLDDTAKAYVEELMAKAGMQDMDNEKDKKKSMKKQSDGSKEDEPTEPTLTKADILKALGATDEGDEAEIWKGVPPVVKEAVDELVQSNTTLKKQVDETATALKKREEAAERDEFIRKAQELSHLPNVTADDFGEILRKASKSLDPKEADRLERVLKGANEALKDSEWFQEVGKASVPAGGVMDEVQGLVADLRKSDPKMTKEQAEARVWKDRPDLYDKYEAERAARSRRNGA